MHEAADAALRNAVRLQHSARQLVHCALSAAFIFLGLASSQLVCARLRERSWQVDCWSRGIERSRAGVVIMPAWYCVTLFLARFSPVAHCVVSVGLCILASKRADSIPILFVDPLGCFNVVHGASFDAQLLPTRI